MGLPWESTNTKVFCLAVEKTEHLLMVILLGVASPPACWLFLTPAVQVFHSTKSQVTARKAAIPVMAAKQVIKTAVVQGYKPVHKAANTAVWEKNESLRSYLFPPRRSQCAGLWKCITQCWEAEISRALVSAILLFPFKFMPASDHHFQQKYVAKRAKARIPSLFWLSTYRHRNVWSFWWWPDNSWFDKSMWPETVYPGLHIRITKTDNCIRDLLVISHRKGSFNSLYMS